MIEIPCSRGEALHEHYHVERNHQGLDNRLIEKGIGTVDMNSAIERRQRLGGVINYYERRAA